jgi:lipopolysaccharide/colanic/teichoic acid biosynthesis glycosyltransferase
MNIKRIMDVGVASVVIILTSPLWLVIAILIQIDSKGPVFFRQLRPGLRGRPYKLIKFRTMVEARDPAGNLLPDAERLTRIGCFLRSTSLDELPELINVLKGEMSLVGPRPLLTRYLPYYSEREFRRHSVRPGLTGWAQINGRNLVAWSERLELDVWYVENWSLLLDLRIIFMTLVLVLKREGVVVDPESRMLSLDAERRGAPCSGRNPASPAE